MPHTVERRRWLAQSGERLSVLPSDCDRVIATFATLLGSRVTPRAARQRLRRIDAGMQLFCLAAHRENAPHRLSRWHRWTGVQVPCDGTTPEDWQRIGLRDRNEDAARERVLLAPDDLDAWRRLRADVAKEVAEKSQLLNEIDARLEASNV